MNFAKGFCRIETKDRVVFGELTEIYDTFVLIIDFEPPAVEIDIQKSDIVHYEPINEDDIPPYE